MELNLICHMHCIVGVVINFDLLLNWVGIYLYLVTTNKILTHFKSNAHTFGEFMHIIPHNLLSNERM
jgi:hypothetical protein